jgi:hypothetical protein
MAATRVIKVEDCWKRGYGMSRKHRPNEPQATFDRLSSTTLPISCLDLQANSPSRHSVARALTLENAARPIGQHHPQRQAAFAHRAVRDHSGIVELAAHHRSHAALIGASNRRTLLGHCQRDIHHRVAACTLHLHEAASVGRGPFPQTGDVRKPERSGSWCVWRQTGRVQTVGKRIGIVPAAPRLGGDGLSTTESE